MLPKTFSNFRVHRIVADRQISINSTTPRRCFVTACRSTTKSFVFEQRKFVEEFTFAIFQLVCLVDDHRGPFDFTEARFIKVDHLVRGQHNIRSRSRRRRVRLFIFWPQTLLANFQARFRVAAIRDDVQMWNPRLALAFPVRQRGERARRPELEGLSARVRK